jgi:hypothetical protein
LQTQELSAEIYGRAPLQNRKRRQENGDRTLLPASPFALCHASKLINAESGVIDRLCSSNISTTWMRDAPRRALNANRPFHKKIAVITLILIYTILKGTNSWIICNTGETLNQNCRTQRPKLSLEKTVFERDNFRMQKDLHAAARRSETKSQ